MGGGICTDGFTASSIVQECKGLSGGCLVPGTSSEGSGADSGSGSGSGSDDSSNDSSDACNGVTAVEFSNKCYFTGSNAKACCNSIDGATSSNIFEEATGETCDDAKTAIDTAVEGAEAIGEKLGSTKVCQYVYDDMAIGDWINVFVDAAGCCGEGISVCGTDGKGKDEDDDGDQKNPPTDAAGTLSASIVAIVLGAGAAML